MRKLYEGSSSKFKALFDSYSVTVGNLRTLDEYIGYINLLCTYLGRDFLELTLSDANKYMAHMMNSYHDGRLSRKTICVRLSCYKTVAGYIEESEKVSGYENPFKTIRRPEKTDDSIKSNHIPSMEELDLIMSCAKSDKMYYLILALATRVGLTVSNILNIRVSNIVEESGRYFVKIVSKSDFKSDRYIPLPADVTAILQDYLEDVEPDAEGHIFFNSHRHPLRLRNVDAGVEKIVKMSGVANRYTMKDLRSRAILEMVKAGSDINDIKDYTGLSQLRIQTFVSAKALVSKECPADLVNYQLKTS